MSMELDLMVPGLLDRLSEWRDFEGFPRFTATERLLGRSRLGSLPVRGYEATLCHLTGMAVPELPLAQLTDSRAAVVGDPVRLCADPVHLRADLRDVYLLAGGRLGVGESEARRLTDLFNTHFGEQGLHLYPGTAGRWHLFSEKAFQVSTTPISEVMGSDILRRLPGGRDGSRLRSLINETQMLFHDSAVNRERRERGVPELSTVWFYGAGKLPPLAERPWVGVWATDVLARQIGFRSGARVRPLPDGLADLEAESMRGSHLVVLDPLLEPARFDEPDEWIRAAEHLERDWFAAILQAFADGSVTRCRLYDCSGRVFRLNRGDLWRIWRRPKPLEHFAGVSSS